MKYHVQSGCLFLGEKPIESEPHYFFVECCHEAAIEFWQEIEQLRAANAELVVACKSCLAEIDDFEMVGAYPTISERNGYADWRSGIEAAIARAESAEGGEGCGE